MVVHKLQGATRRAAVVSRIEPLVHARYALPTAALAKYLPGVGLAGAVTLLATMVAAGFSAISAALLGQPVAPPIMALALLLGLLAHAAVDQTRFGPGLALCSTTVLRALVALIGLRVALSDLVHLGLELAMEILLAMGVTLATAIFVARRFAASPGVGAIMGAANAICGQAATLAAASALPKGSCSRESIVLTIVLSSTISTTAMVVYPLLGASLGLSPLQVGVLVGASVQDVPQVVGAALGLPLDAGNAAITVKMFRVLMLLPAVAAIAWWFAGTARGASLPKVPRFAVGFLVVSVVNSMILVIPGLAQAYAPLRDVLIEATGWGLVVGISAVGLETSLAGLKAQGLRPVAIFLSASLTMLGASLLIAAGSGP